MISISTPSTVHGILLITLILYKSRNSPFEHRNVEASNESTSAWWVRIRVPRNMDR